MNHIPYSKIKVGELFEYRFSKRHKSNIYLKTDWIVFEKSLSVIYEGPSRGKIHEFDDDMIVVIIKGIKNNEL